MTDLCRLPNLVALRAFEAAARHQNCSLALPMKHMSLTAPSAIRCSGQLHDLVRDGIDVGIRFGRGQYPGLTQSG
jgi:DNA-binding transcriptional LysR family regulator